MHVHASLYHIAVTWLPEKVPMSSTDPVVMIMVSTVAMQRFCCGSRVGSSRMNNKDVLLLSHRAHNGLNVSTFVFRKEVHLLTIVILCFGVSVDSPFFQGLLCTGDQQFCLSNRWYQVPTMFRNMVGLAFLMAGLAATVASSGFCGLERLRFSSKCRRRCGAPESEGHDQRQSSPLFQRSILRSIWKGSNVHLYGFGGGDCDASQGRESFGSRQT